MIPLWATGRLQEAAFFCFQNTEKQPWESNSRHKSITPFEQTSCQSNPCSAA